MNNEEKYLIYLHVNKKTGIVFYVGIGDYKRAYNFYKSSRNGFWWNYVKKNGIPEVKIVANGISLQQAAILEIDYIKLYGRRGIDQNGILVNRSEGGEKTAKGFKHSEEAILKISAASKRQIWSKESRNKLSATKTGVKQSESHRIKNSLAKTGKNHPNYGKNLSEETKNKIRSSNIGKSQNNSKKRKVINIVTKEIYESALYVAKKFLPNIHPNGFHQLLNGKVTNWSDYQYLDDYNKGIKKYECLNNRSKPIRIIHNETGTIYNSIIEASRKLNINESKIRWHASGKLVNTIPLFSIFK